MSTEKHTADVGHVEANPNTDGSWRDEKWGTEQRNLSVVAQERAFDEKEMSIAQAIKVHKWAIWWSFAISLTVIMEGFGEFSRLSSSRLRTET